MAKPKKSKPSKKHTPLTIEIHGNGIAISARIDTGASGKSAGALIDEVARRLTNATPANADDSTPEAQPSIEIVVAALRKFPDEFLDQVGDAVRDEMTARTLRKASPAAAPPSEPTEPEPS